MRITPIIPTLLLIFSLLGSAQPLTARQLIARPLPTEPLLAQRNPTHQTSAKRTEYKEKIGLDMSVPDFNTQKIDAKVMGNRLAGILDYLMENYQQGTYIEFNRR